MSIICTHKLQSRPNAVKALDLIIKNIPFYLVKLMLFMEESRTLMRLRIASKYWIKSPSRGLATRALLRAH